jgi:hypothetical protein
MSVFWLGTVPALIGVGVLIRPLSLWLGGRTPMVLSAALVIVGLGTLAARFSFAEAAGAPASCPLHSGGER